MLILDKEEPIFPLKKAMATLGCDIEKLIKTVAKNDIHLVILPEQPIEIGIRLPKNKHDRMLKLIKENSLNVEPEALDGFIPSTENNEKTLRTLNWKTSNPKLAVYTNSKKNIITAQSPYTLASKTAHHEGKCDHYCPCNISKERHDYLHQEFYFINIISQRTKLKLDEIFLLSSEIEKLKNSLHGELKPDFSDIGEYQANPWSNQLIKDINAIHHYLQKNNMINDTKDKKIAQRLVTSWLEERYKEKKLTANCLEQIPKIVSNSHSEAINFEAILEEEIKNLTITEKLTRELSVKKSISEKNTRNRKKSTDLIVLIDILAEKHYKGKKEMNEIKRNKESKYPLYKSYIRGSLIAEKLVSAGIAKGVLQQAIYSIIKHKFSEIEDR